MEHEHLSKEERQHIIRDYNLPPNINLNAPRESLLSHRIFQAEYS